MKKVRKLVDALFLNKKETEELIAMREEIMNNAIERYNDVIESGGTEEAALDAVRESLAGMESVISSMRDASADIAVAAQREGVENVIVNLIAADLKVETGDVEAPRVLQKLRKSGELPYPHYTLEGGTLTVKSDAEEERPRPKLEYIRVVLPRGMCGNILLSAVSSDISVSAPARKLSVKTTSGDIALHAATEEVTASAASGDIRMAGSAKIASIATLSGDIRCTAEGGIFKIETQSGDIDCDIKNPDVKHVSLRTGVGDISCTARGGELILHTRSGDISVASAEGTLFSVDAQTQRGDIKLTGGAEKCLLSSGDGDIRCTLREAGSVSVKAQHGDISLQASDKTISSALLESANGDIRISGYVSECAARAARGDISVRGSMGRVDLQSQKGDISCEIENAGIALLEARTESGDISLRFATEPIGASVEAASKHGDVKNRLPIGDGSGGAIRAYTNWGDITIG